MRGPCLCALALTALALASSGLTGGEAAELELKKIQGTWRFIAQEMDGKARPAEELTKLNITFNGDKWEVRLDGKVVQAGTHKLDPAKKHVDAVVTEGEGKGVTMPGIYELKGDTMKVAFDTKGKDRPTGFATKAGQFSAEVHREKK